jgi:hypothetical protein
MPNNTRDLNDFESNIEQANRCLQRLNPKGEAESSAGKFLRGPIIFRDGQLCKRVNATLISSQTGNLSGYPVNYEADLANTPWRVIKSRQSKEHLPTWYWMCQFMAEIGRSRYTEGE